MGISITSEFMLALAIQELFYQFLVSCTDFAYKLWDFLSFHTKKKGVRSIIKSV
jgi:hypothetical protein